MFANAQRLVKMSLILRKFVASMESPTQVFVNLRGHLARSRKKSNSNSWVPAVIAIFYFLRCLNYFLFGFECLTELIKIFLTYSFV